MLRQIVFVQLAFIGAFGIAYGLRWDVAPQELTRAALQTDPLPEIELPRRVPIPIPPLYDRDDIPDVVSEEDVAYVLKRIRPRFKGIALRPNLVEHALRTWGHDAQFEDPDVMSGADMVGFLTDHGRFTQVWGADEEPLLQVRPTGIGIRWGLSQSGSVHHDHWLASLSEAGVSLDTPVYGPGRHNATMEDVLLEAMRDFELDERETEWTAMAFGLWLPPSNEWIGREGRKYSFDLLARRLLRGHSMKGVCVGTHRLYSMVLLLRLDEMHPEVLSDEVHADVVAHMEKVRDSLKVSQFDEGYWPGNWWAGAEAVRNPVEEKESNPIISTGHHLEWQAIAPAFLRLSDEQNRRAAAWLVSTMKSHSDEDVQGYYTFYSHVGNCLAMWRKTRPTPFWREWTAAHPGFEMEADPTIPSESRVDEAAP